MIKLRLVFIFTFLLSLALAGYTQSTYSKVYSIFQASCTIGCHTAANPSGGLILNDGEIEVYSRIVNADPVNPISLSKREKIIAPGHPEKSFLFRKCNNGWDPYYTALSTAEGSTMPQGYTSLSDIEMETIRQWILFGAPETGVVVPDSIISDYYNGKGMKKVAAPAPIDTSLGIQVRMGPFFLGPKSEVEYAKKNDPFFKDFVEVNRIEVFMNPTSHHFVTGLMDEVAVPFTAPGLRDDVIDFSRLLISTQYSNDFVLPNGSAYSWPWGFGLDMSYHIVNYETDSILQADVYLNIYKQPVGTAQAIMRCRQIDFRPNLVIPNNNFDVFLSDSIYKSGSQDKWNIWMISSHTHQWGRDYDIYLRDVDGAKGEKIYEGFYNTDHSFNQGYYDWAHPAVRFFEPLKTINIAEGLIHEALFRNSGPDTAFYGPDANDEMMAVIIQYTVNWERKVSVYEVAASKTYLKVLPNPFKNSFNIFFNSIPDSEIIVNVFNTLGQKIKTSSFSCQSESACQHLLDMSGFSNGIYYIEAKSNTESFFQKVLKAE